MGDDGSPVEFFLGIGIVIYHFLGGSIYDFVALRLFLIGNDDGETVPVHLVVGVFSRVSDAGSRLVVRHGEGERDGSQRVLWPLLALLAFAASCQHDKRYYRKYVFRNMIHISNLYSR